MPDERPLELDELDRHSAMGLARRAKSQLDAIPEGEMVSGALDVTDRFWTPGADDSALSSPTRTEDALPGRR
jgi:hypothetical protein